MSMQTVPNAVLELGVSGSSVVITILRDGKPVVEMYYRPEDIDAMVESFKQAQGIAYQARYVGDKLQ